MYLKRMHWAVDEMNHGGFKGADALRSNRDAAFI